MMLTELDENIKKIHSQHQDIIKKIKDENH